MFDAELGSLYQQVIMDHAKERHGSGLREGAAASSHQINPTCGDEITLCLHFADRESAGAGAIVQSVSWDGRGCAISQASASMLHDLVDCLSLAQLHQRVDAFREVMHSEGTLAGDPEVLGDAVALAGASRYVSRIKCAMLAWVALENALASIEHDA
ncbi:MAG: Fe-S cluster assembly sulfur transfer protein SufU [Microbacteriaceae bacterium]